MTAQSGAVLGGRYELGEVLGYGGMAEVFLARDVRLGRQVAVKVLRSDLARDPSFLARFRREAQSAASLSHPSIVSVFDTGQDEIAGALVPWIVMEYVEGRTLRDVLRQEGRLLPRRAVEIVSEVCAALGFAHRNGLVHRDIKPANVMLTRTGQVKVMDFGIARALSSASGGLTQTAAVVGTAQYLSPEQARGEHVDARSDIYSTGCLLYELLTGRPPFQGDSPVSVAYQHVREAPVPPSQLDPEIGADLDAVVLTAMAKDPVNRYQSGEAFKDDLDRVATGRRVAATPVMPAAPAATATTQLLSPADSTQILWDGRSAAQERARRRKGYAAIFVACLVVLGAVAFLVSNALSTGPGGNVAMPVIKGQTKDDAIKILKANHLNPGTITLQYETTDKNKGTVIKQDVVSGIPVPRGSSQDFTVSEGIEMKTVPQVKDLSLDNATQALQDQGFKLGTTQTVQDLTKDPNTVVSITPDEGKSLPKGSTVVLTIVDPNTPVPQVTGLPDRQHARDMLAKSKFLVGTITPVPSDQPVGSVIGQDPQPGTSAPRGSAVNLQIAAAMPSPSPSPEASVDTSPSPAPVDVSPSPTVIDPLSPSP